ncbi:RNA-directed DNA polymerase, eukaryota, reverse transcriptase zinc-binding domain protein [Tanacetum coccineum]
MAIEELSSIEKKINAGSTTHSDIENRLKLLHELEDIDKFSSMDLILKARVKWDIKGDKNSKFFHGLINQKRQNQMINGIMIEGIEIIEWHKKRNKQLLIFKVDFEKAFDSISWKYLDHILDSLGFGYTWRSWIKSCLSSLRASILVNGSPTSEFFINHGLRQGDPL